jgi:hypothetical protein
MGFYNRGNILGTVSQSGGVPTGAIIERGSNANGEFVKFADGTMICTGSFSTSIAIASSFLGGFRSTGSVIVNMPTTFPGSDYALSLRGSIEEPSFSVIENVASRGAATFVPIFTAVASQTAANRAFRYIAIGRWY